MKSQKELDKIELRANRTFYGRNVIPPRTLGVTLPGLGVDINQVIQTQTIPNVLGSSNLPSGLKQTKDISL